MSSSVIPAVVHCLRALSLVAVDLVQLVALAARPRAALVAENLFLRKQLALFQERKVRPRRADESTRWMMAAGGHGARRACSPHAGKGAEGECLLRRPRWQSSPGVTRFPDSAQRRPSAENCQRMGTPL